MRQLKASEALVGLETLSGGPTGRPSSLPRRTRQTVARRLEEWGWFTRRWVPSSNLMGEQIVTLCSFAPFADRRAEIRQHWQLRPDAVVVWEMDGSFFGAFASPDRGAADALLSQVEDPDLGVPVFHLRTEATTSSAPVWFDFAGAWARTTGLEVPPSYPLGFEAAAGPAAPGEAPPAGAAEQNAASALIAASESEPRGSAAPVGGLQERCVRRGWVIPRTFLNPSAVARTIGTFPAHIALLHGRIRGSGGRGADDPLLALSGPLRPFLLARNGSEVLLATLSVAGRRGREAKGASSPPVLSYLAQYIERIRVLREPLATARELVNHRYSVFTQRSSASTRPSPEDLSPQLRAAPGAGAERSRSRSLPA
ncbi:MAG TPA: hypothetical protein VFG07_07905 [Thermoplasmata archaeon]|nr:hypothetical protein [Thermoplasmata archaeon]